MKRIDRITEAIRTPSPLVRQRDAIRAVQSEGIFRRLVAGGWLVPVVKEHKYVAFRRSDLDAALARILAGEMPPSLKARK